MPHFFLPSLSSALGNQPLTFLPSSTLLRSAASSKICLPVISLFSGVSKWPDHEIQQNCWRLWDFQLSVSDPVQSMFLLLILSLGLQLQQTVGKKSQRLGRVLRKRNRWWPLAEDEDENVVLGLKAFFKRKGDYRLWQALSKEWCPWWLVHTCFPILQKQGLIILVHLSPLSSKHSDKMTGHSDHALLKWPKRTWVKCPERWDVKQLFFSLLSETLPLLKSNSSSHWSFTH